MTQNEREGKANKKWLRKRFLSLTPSEVDTLGTVVYGKTPLSLAVKHDGDVVMSILSKGADVNLKEGYGLTALHNASNLGRNRIVSILISHGADVNARSRSDEQTPLHFAALSSPEICCLLLDAGADPRIKDTWGQRPVDTIRAFGFSFMNEIAALMDTKIQDFDLRDRWAAQFHTRPLSRREWGL